MLQQPESGFPVLFIMSAALFFGSECTFEFCYEGRFGFAKGRGVTFNAIDSVSVGVKCRCKATPNFSNFQTFAIQPPFELKSHVNA